MDESKDNKKSKKEKDDEQKQQEKDEEERLVREVIAENPVEDRGVREEWVGKVGWHRKEDIFANNDNSGNNRLRGRKRGVKNGVVEESGEMPNNGETETSADKNTLYPLTPFLTVLFLCLLLLLLYNRSFIKMLSKRRRGVEKYT